MDRNTIETRVRALYAGGPDARQSFSDAIIWHVPGRNPVSGRYEGTDAYFRTMPERMAPLDTWDFTVGRVMVNEPDRAALVEFHLTGERHGIRIATTGFHFVRLDEDGLVVEGWGFTEDQDGLDRFFAA